MIDKKLMITEKYNDIVFNKYQPKDMTLLVDGDVWLHKYASPYEFCIDFETGEVTTSTKRTNEGMSLIAYEGYGIEALTVLMEQLESKFKKVRIVFSGKDNFRNKVEPSYKSNRSGLLKPYLSPIMKDFLIENYDTISIKHLEGDDVLSIFQSGEPDKYVIYTIDKDLNQIEGLHYIVETDDFYIVDYDDGVDFFYYQILKGDPVDGYGGCPMIGDKKAIKILGEAKVHFENSKKKYPNSYKSLEYHYWLHIIETYKKKALDEDYALRQARMARMLTKDEWCKKTQKIKLWKPKEK